jgi:hypothetical protein
MFVYNIYYYYSICKVYGPAIQYSIVCRPIHNGMKEKELLIILTLNALNSDNGKFNALKRLINTCVAEPEPHHLVGARAVMRCGSGSDGSRPTNGFTHG